MILPIEENTTLCIYHKICGAENQNLYIYMANHRWQEGLNAWIDVQLQKPRKPFLRVDSIDEILEAFDPLRRMLGAANFAIPAL